MSKEEFIKFIPHKIPTKKKSFLISFSLFRMEGAYRNFNKYFDSLKQLLKKSNISDCDICIFIDDSVMSYKPFRNWLDSEIKKHDQIYILQYFCKDFIKPDTNYHYGTFGSIVRLYALTNEFKEKYGNYKAILISDVDMQPYEVDQKNIINMINKKATISYRTRIYYNKVWAHNTLEFPIMIGTFISSLTFPAELLISFLKDLKNKKYKNIVDAIITENISKKRRHIYLTDDLFVYGLDEYFANNLLLQYYNDHDCKALIYVDPFINKLPYLLPDFQSSDKIKGSDVIAIINSYEKLNLFFYKKQMVKYYSEIYDYLIKHDFENVLELKEYILRAIPFMKEIDINNLSTSILLPINVYDKTKSSKKNKDDCIYTYILPKTTKRVSKKTHTRKIIRK